MPTALEANAAAFLGIAVVGVSLILAGVSVLGWRRLGSAKLLYVALAFVVLAVKGLFLVSDAMQGGAPLIAGSLDLATVLLLYASVAQR